MDILPEATAITAAIESNNPDRLISTIKEYARITRNPHNDSARLKFGPSIPYNPDLVFCSLETDDGDPADWLHNERRWLSDLFYNTGNDCLRKDRYGLALVCYEESAKLRPFPSIYNNIASTYKRIGNYDEAIKYHKKNISEYPDYIPSYGRLAILLEAYNCDTEDVPLDYFNLYFKKGGNRPQLEAFVVGTPAAEGQALQRLILARASREADERRRRQQAKNKPPKRFKI